MKKTAVPRAVELIRSRGGTIRTSQAIAAGISPRTLYFMRDNGIVLELTRGLFRLAAARPLAHPDLVQAAMAVPKGVICLISALAFHDLTTQIPHQVYVALPVRAERPRVSYPPMRFFWLSPRTYESGVETHTLDRMAVQIYAREKTIADCFKFRNKIGIDVGRDALREGLRRGCRPEVLLEYAQIDRVERTMRPFLEALL